MAGATMKSYLVRVMMLTLLLVAVFLGGFLAGQGIPALPPGPGSPAPAAGPIASLPVALEAPPEDLSPEELRNIEIFRRAAASVVYITRITLRRDFFSLNVFQIPEGSGSGFVWDQEGHVVTNFHVIEGGQAFSITLADQATYEAELVGIAPDKDLAVLKIDAPREKLVPLSPGRSDDLLVGQKVLAVGNPFGLDQTLTVGVISALGRELQAPNNRTIQDVIQTDAAINPGNSGGPLLDSRGRLIGINTAIYSPSGASAGIGFAVPVNAVTRLVPQIIKHGEPIQPGIGIRALPAQMVRGSGIEGVVIARVQRNGPADRAELRGVTRNRFGRPVVGDVIVAVDGTPVRSIDDLLHAFEGAGVGTTVTLTVERDQKRRDVQVTLEALNR